MSYKQRAPLPVEEGGTESLSFTPYAVICGGTTSTSALQSIVGLGASGTILTSNGAGTLPTFQAPTGGVTSVTGTANQITASPTTGAVILSTPSTFIAPGSIAATTTVTATLGNITATSGNIAIPYTTTTVGMLTMNATPWIHNYSTGLNGRNFFAGGNAGNLTNTGTGNTGISGGYSFNSLSGLTSGNSNTCIGKNTGTSITSGGNNTYIGAQCGQLGAATTSNNTGLGAGALVQASGTGNCSLGYFSNAQANAGDYNLSVGTGTLQNLGSAGSYNTVIGAGQNSVTTSPGYNYGSGSPSNNILLCHPGVSAESNVMRLGNTGTGTMLVNKCFIAAIYNNTTIGVTNHVVSVDSDGQLGLSSTPPGAVSSVTGTTNQITASPTTGAVILTTPSTFIAPGSIAATTTVTATLGDVTITSGNVAITAATTSSVGQVTQAGNRLIHTYGGDGAGDDTNSNVFVGQLAGNFTLKVAANFGGNVSLGYNTLLSLDGGTENVAIGNKALKLLTGANNGSSGYRNTAVGTGALASALTSRYCIGIGYHAGSALTSSENSNIYINNSGVVAESNCLRIGAGAGTGEGQLNKAVIYGIYNIAVGSTNHVVSVDSNGQLGLASNPQFFTWTTVTGTTQALAVNNGYVLNNAGLVTATLPATAVVGDRIEITGLGAGGWLIAQNASQLVRLGSSVTTTGTGGSLASTNRYDSLTLICIVTNTTWTVMGPVGNITVV